MDGWVRILNIICEKLNTQVPSKKSIRNLISVIEKRCKLKNSIKNETKINVELTKALKVRIENNMEFYKIK